MTGKSPTTREALQATEDALEALAHRHPPPTVFQMWEELDKTAVMRRTALQESGSEDGSSVSPKPISEPLLANLKWLAGGKDGRETLELEVRDARAILRAIGEESL